MHAYITDSEERRAAPLLIAAIAIGFYLGLTWLLESCKVGIPGWVDVTSVPLLYGIFYTLFDKYCWHWWIFRRLGIVRIPLLEGTWNGHVCSSFDEFAVEHRIQIKVEQQWTEIRIQSEGDLSRSHSILGAVFTNAPEGIVLDYEYQNEPLPGAREAMQIHHGTARLRLTSAATMEGYYYTGRGRGNHGSVQLTRAS